MEFKFGLVLALAILSGCASENVLKDELSEADAEISLQLQDPNFIPTVEELLSAEKSHLKDALVRKALEKWEQGTIANCLRQNSRLRTIMLNAFYKDMFYDPSISSMSSCLRFDDFYRVLLKKRLLSEFAGELGIDNGLFNVLFADKDTSVRLISLKLLIFFDRQIDKIDIRVDAAVYRSWMNSQFATTLGDTDAKIVREALRYALRTKACLEMETIEKLSLKSDGKYIRDSITLSLNLRDREDTVDFLLKKYPTSRRMYREITKELDLICSSGQIASTVMYDKVQKKLLDDDFLYVYGRLLMLMKKCDRGKAVDYMLKVFMGDKTGEHIRKGRTRPAVAGGVLHGAAVAEDIPQLIEAHKRRTNTWHFDRLGMALVKAGDEDYIRVVVEDYVLSDEKRKNSDIKKGIGWSHGAADILRYAIYETKPQWAFELVQTGLEDMNCSAWFSLKGIAESYGLGYCLEAMEARLEKDTNKNNTRKLRRSIKRLRAKIKKRKV